MLFAVKEWIGQADAVRRTKGWTGNDAKSPKECRVAAKPQACDKDGGRRGMNVGAKRFKRVTGQGQQLVRGEKTNDYRRERDDGRDEGERERERLSASMKRRGRVRTKW